MNQWRGWVAMDVREKSAVIYFSNGDDAKNGSGHGYGHVLADVIVAPEVELAHGLDWFFQKFGVSRDVDEGWKSKEEADTTRIDIYVRSCLASPPKPLKETRGLAALEVARETTQQYRSATKHTRLSESGSAATLGGDEAAEGYKAPSPFQITPKPLKE